MTSITPKLNEQITNNPDKDYAVLITLKNEILPAVLTDKGRFIMADKIFSAKMSGAEIEKLKSENEIEAIEPDEEMCIL